MIPQKQQRHRAPKILIPVCHIPLKRTRVGEITKSKVESRELQDDTEKGCDLEPSAAVLQCLLLDTRLLEQQHTKKL